MTIVLGKGIEFKKKNREMGEKKGGIATNVPQSVF